MIRTVIQIDARNTTPSVASVAVWNHIPEPKAKIPPLIRRPAARCRSAASLCRPSPHDTME
uniref:Uncharacterized protein n=1 Tax=Setaria italica TaxID=4555 RepID=K4ANB8_SETIT